MKQTIIIGMLVVTALLVSCAGGESSKHDFAGTFITPNGIRFELRADSTALITLSDTMTYESSWKTGKDRNGETYANIEFTGNLEYYYLKDGKLYRSVREMNHDALGEKVKYLK